MAIADILAQLRDLIGDIDDSAYKMADTQLYAAIRAAVTFCQLHDFPSGAPYSHDGASPPVIAPVPTFRGECVVAGVAAASILRAENADWATGELRYKSHSTKSWREIAADIVGLGTLDPGGITSVRIIQTIGISERGIPDQVIHTVNSIEDES